MRGETRHANGRKLVPALFLHIQKTAGTSIVDMARMHYGNENVVSHGDYLAGWNGRSLEEIVAARGRSPEDFRSIPFVSGHFGFDFARTLFSGRYSFTFLRDPAERILSYYYFCRTRDPLEYEIYELSQRLSLDEFLALSFERPALKACVWNNQTWQLANGYGNMNGRRIEEFTEGELFEEAIRHLKAFSYVGFFENYDNDRNHILMRLGMSLPNSTVVSNANPGRPSRKDLPEKTLSLLDRLTELDRQLYVEAQNLQKQRLRQSGVVGYMMELTRGVRRWFVK